ncbi:MAG: Hsp20 family protein [Spirosoma sp.]|nr:Hsp20 family protein [Spirosoma sp.]
MATLVQYNRPAFFSPLHTRPVVNRFYNTRPNGPAANVQETETGFSLALATPGLKKEDFTIRLENTMLTISYQPEATETKEIFTRQEFGVSPFERSFQLPKTVDANAITAAYADGILTVQLPKVEVKSEVKEISIS